MSREVNSKAIENTSPVCPLCGPDPGRDLLWSGGAYRLVRCQGCGLAFRDTWPEPSQYQGPAYFDEYLARRDEFLTIFREIVAEISRFCRSPGLLLDVGCSVGYFMEAAREAGWQPEGVEISEWAATHARESGFSVSNSDLVSAGLPPARYDVVVVNHVLEHVPRPLEFLRECGRVLKPGGVLVVGVPNFGSLMARIEREHWPALQPDEHIWQFSPATLALMLGRAGFRGLGRTSGMQARNFGPNPKDVMKRLLYWAASLYGTGEVMTVYARTVQAKVR